MPPITPQKLAERQEKVVAAERAENMKIFRSHFDKYDANNNNILERKEFRLLAQDQYHFSLKVLSPTFNLSVSCLPLYPLPCATVRLPVTVSCCVQETNRLIKKFDADDSVRSVPTSSQLRRTINLEGCV